MELKNKVYETLVNNNFYNLTDAQTIILKLSKELNVSNNKIFNAIKELIVEEKISAEGKEIKNRGQILQGVFHDSKSTYGFVTVPGFERDFFVRDKRGAMEGDKIQIGFINNNGKQEAFISKILERENSIILGTVQKTSTGLYVFKPDDKRIPICAIAQDSKAKEALGKKCSLKMLSNEVGKNEHGYGIIDRVFGFAEDPIVENIAIAYKYGFTKEFPAEVMAEVARIPQEVTKEDMVGRLDLRKLDFMPWDPKGCKDKDDAMYVEKTKTGYRAYVAIADVSHYVKEGSAIDREAYKRGTSCYLGDGVYPMLPPELSNGICSLNDNVPRLVQVAIVDIDEKGKILDFQFEKAVIEIKQSFCYEDAEKIHLCQEGLDVKYKKQKPQIDLLYKVSDILTQKLNARGSLTFKSNEPTFKFDETKTRVVDVLDTSDVTSHNVVEQFMILANEAAAMYLQRNQLNGLYRIHEGPRQDKLAEVNRILQALKIDYRLEPTPHSYQRLTEIIKGSKYEDFITGIMLRSLNKAKYNPVNVGHFGLASVNYLHFTSPIRRYPDLEDHRIIAGHNKKSVRTKSKAELEERGMHLTEQEKKAEQAEVQSDKLLNALWASEHVGEMVKGYISALSKGAVTIRVGLVEMTIPVTELANGDIADYKLSDDKMTLKDKYSKNRYSLADEIEVMIYQADIENKMILATTDLTKELKKAPRKQEERTKPKPRNYNPEEIYGHESNF